MFKGDGEDGRPFEVSMDWDVAKTADGGHDLWLGWYGSNPDQCLDVTDESDCGIPIVLDFGAYRLRLVSASFQVNRIVASVSALLPEETEMTDIAERVALLLHDKVTGCE